LPRGFDSREFDIIPVLLSQVRAVGAIFLVVPHMMVAAVPVVVPFCIMIVGPYCQGAVRAVPEKNAIRIKKRSIGIISCD
jgi:hypothetical protein